MPPPRKKRPPAGQSVPGAGTISAHRDALWWASGAVGQKPPGRGRKNSPGGGRGLCTGCAHGGAAGNGGVWCREATARAARQDRGHTRRKNSLRRGPGAVCRLRPWGKGGNGRYLVAESDRTGRTPGQRARPGAKTAPGGGRRLSGCGIWVLLAPGDPCDLNAQGGQHSQAEDHAQLSQGEVCHQEQAMQSGDQQHSQEQQHAHAEGSQ